MGVDREITLYVDDTGTKESTDLRTRLFAYAGVVIFVQDESRLKESLIEIKERYFGARPEIKSRWLRIPNERYKHYLKPFGLTEDQISDFVRELYDFVGRAPLRCLGAVVDKQRLRNQYKRQFDPSPICYELLLQRLANLCTQYNVTKANVIFDDMDGKNVNGSEWKKLLQRQHRNLRKGYSPFYKNWDKQKQNRSMRYERISEELVFHDSRDDELIQIADLCAYNIFRQARDNWGSFDTEPLYDGYKWIKDRMHKSKQSGRITTFGALCFPKR